MQQAIGASEGVLPLDEFVFKEPRCDLEPHRDRYGNFVGGCDYVPPEYAAATNRHGCYQYAFGIDRSPPMSEAVMRQAALQIGRHAATHELEQVRIIKHGGEPLLRGAAELALFSDVVPQVITSQSPGTRVRLYMQTNGLRLAPKKAKDEPEAEQLLSILKDKEYTVGLSLDGDREANDRHRRDARGGSTYDRVVKAARRLREKGIPWGILCVIDTQNDPVATMESLASHQPDSIDLLLPHANHSLPKPPGPVPYGEWLKTAFDWYYDQAEEPIITMPILENYMDVLRGGKSTHESVANRPTQELFVLPNGYWQRVDTLLSTEAAAAATGKNVFEHSLDDIARNDPGIIARRLGKAGLAEECLRCPLLEPCGGGYYPHRFKAGERKLKTTDSPEAYAAAFRNPSVYCNDMLTLLPHIAVRMEKSQGLPRGTLIANLQTKRVI